MRQCSFCEQVMVHGALGEAGSQWEDSWFCLLCWKDWADDHWQDRPHSAHLRNTFAHESMEEAGWGDEKVSGDWQSCTTADDCEAGEELHEEWGEEVFCIADWQSLATVDEDEYSDEEDLSVTRSGCSSPTTVHAEAMAPIAAGIEPILACLDGAISPCPRCPRKAAAKLDLLTVLNITPVARAFWQLAEPFKGLNAQQSQARHRLSGVSSGFAQAVREACSAFSESELVSEVISRWQAYERQLAIEMLRFNRKQAAARPDFIVLPMVPSQEDADDSGHVSS